MRKILIAFAALFAVGVAAAAEAQAPGRYSGNIRFSTTAVGFIVGVEWGSGSMTLPGGRVYNLRVRTLKAGMAGVEGISANGRIYDLHPGRPHDITGTYTSIGAGVTVGGGVGVQRMKNEKGVIIEISETSQGLAAKIAASGVAIELVR
jgi:hypothetical protein